MSERTEPDRSELPLDVLDRIDRACDRFEAALRRGEEPDPADFLGAVAPEYRPALLRDLRAAEADARRRRAGGPGPGHDPTRPPRDAGRPTGADGPPGPEDQAAAFVRMSRRAADLLSRAHREAACRGHPYVDPVHILRALLDGSVGLAARILKASGVDRTTLLAAVDSALGDFPREPGQAAQGGSKRLSRAPRPDAPGRRPRGRCASRDGDGRGTHKPSPCPSFAHRGGRKRADRVGYRRND
jgi:hypothetical protein